jgi:hypothetical protein
MLLRQRDHKGGDGAFAGLGFLGYRRNKTVYAAGPITAPTL